jgi:AAA15 family ATPase/GTPase
MITSVVLKNFGPLESIEWNCLAKINLVLGGNGQGKTFLLKAMYAAIKGIEQNGRGNDNRTISEIISDKLYWTFQSEKLGELVRKPVESPLGFSMTTEQGDVFFAFGQDTTRKVTVTSDTLPTETNSIFLPAKEVLSLQKIILKSREQDAMFGFDDTYFDLARALRISTTKGRNLTAFASSREKLRDFLGGKIEFDPQKDRWTFKKGSFRFPIGTTSEGTKKTAILDTLLGNRYLTTDSRIFIDEPEAALHPQAISELMEIIMLLAECGIQFFIATHSYFVIKKLFIIALEKNMSIPVLSLGDGNAIYNDMLDGMPKNSIIDESVRLYEEEVRVSLS